MAALAQLLAREVFEDEDEAAPLTLAELTPVRCSSPVCMGCVFPGRVWPRMRSGIAPRQDGPHAGERHSPDEERSWRA